MNFRILIAAVVISVACGEASATYCKDGSLIESHPGGDCNYKPPAPVTSTSRSDASAAAAARSRSASRASVGDVAATGGNASSSSTSAGGDASSSLQGIGNDSSTSSFRALSLALPAPVFTPPLPLSGCPQANVTQESGALLWNGFSHASGSVNTDNCTAILIYNALLARCKYASASRVLAGLTAKVLPGTELGGGDLDLSDSQCRVLLNPPTPTPPAPPVIFTAAAPSCPAPAPARRKVARVVVTGCKA